jgi:hypothetical protein
MAAAYESAAFSDTPVWAEGALRMCLLMRRRRGEVEVDVGEEDRLRPCLLHGNIK